MIEKDKPLIQIADLPEREAEPADPEQRGLGERTVDLHELDKDGKRRFSDRDFCWAFGREEDFREVRKTIERRLAETPKETAVKCGSCGYRTTIRGALESRRTACLFCNPRSDPKGGMFKAMSAGEVKEWGADKKREMERTAPERARQAAARGMANQAELSKLK